MKLKPYPEYKDSGVEWLGNIPLEWRLTKIKHVASFTTGWTPPTGDHESFEGDNLWANISDLGPKVLYETTKRVSDAAIKKSNISISPKGSLLFSFKLSIGQVGFAGTDLYTNEAIATFLPDNEARLDYLYYASTVYIVENTSFNIYGAKLLNQELIKSACIAMPDQIGQMRIASFLDSETSKLDTLISKQEKLIELLQEKRQAIISHAVTKGLNPDAKMKDSGVEWLGMVPSHWQIKKIKHVLNELTDFTSNGSFASLAQNVTYLQEGYSRLVRLTDLRENLENDGLYVDKAAHEFLSKSELFGGEVLIANVGAYAGYSCLMPVIKEKATLGPNMYLMNFNEKLTSNYFIWLALNAHSLKEQLVLASTSTAQPKLNKDDVKTCFFVLPPLEEQNEIIRHLNFESTKVDNLIEKAKRSIELAKEHRIALISAAVTGKIDVREAA